MVRAPPSIAATALAAVLATTGAASVAALALTSTGAVDEPTTAQRADCVPEQEALAAAEAEFSDARAAKRAARADARAAGTKKERRAAKQRARDAKQRQRDAADAVVQRRIELEACRASASASPTELTGTASPTESPTAPRCPSTPRTSGRSSSR